MVSGLERRLKNIELARAPARKVWVIEGPDDMETSVACEGLGIEAGPADLIVYLRDFVTENPPRLISGPPR